MIENWSLRIGYLLLDAALITNFQFSISNNKSVSRNPRCVHTSRGIRNLSMAGRSHLGARLCEPQRLGLFRVAPMANSHLPVEATAGHRPALRTVNFGCTPHAVVFEIVLPFLRALRFNAASRRS